MAPNIQHVFALMLAVHVVHVEPGHQAVQRCGHSPTHHATPASSRAAPRALGREGWGLSAGP